MTSGMYDADVDGSFEYGLLHDIGGRGRDVEFHPRVFCLEGPDQFRNAQILISDQRVDDTQVERAGQILVHAAHIAFEALDVGDQLQTGRIHLESLFSQCKTDTAATAQTYTQPDLQALDVAADGRKPELQLGFCGGKPTAFGDGAENAQQPDIPVAQFRHEVSAVDLHLFASSATMLAQPVIFVNSWRAARFDQPAMQVTCHQQ